MVDLFQFILSLLVHLAEGKGKEKRPRSVSYKLSNTFISQCFKIFAVDKLDSHRCKVIALKLAMFVGTSNVAISMENV